MISGVGHHGGCPGFEADDEMILPDEFAAVVLGNDTQFQTSDILDAALTALYPSEVAV
jgi:hypothetical protein